MINQIYKPYVSIIVPTYKRPNKLIQTIKSVKKQTFRNWELIVIDDNNFGNKYFVETEKIMSRYELDLKIRFFQNKKNKGACAARNLGIKKAKGELIAFLDDDDIWLPNKLNLQISLFKKNKKLGLNFSDLILMDTEYNSETLIRFGYQNLDFLKYLLQKGGGICTSAIMVRKEILKKVGGFNESLPSYQDYDLLLKISKITYCERIAKPLIKHLVCSEGISRDYKSKYIGKKMILNLYISDYKKNKLLKSYYRSIETLGDYAARSKDRKKL